MGNGVADPLGDIFRRRIEVEDIVQILMIHFAMDHFLDFLKIDDHAVSVQCFGLAGHIDDPVMTVEMLTLTLIIEDQVMGSGYFHPLGYSIQKAFLPCRAGQL